MKSVRALSCCLTRTHICMSQDKRQEGPCTHPQKAGVREREIPYSVTTQTHSHNNGERECEKVDRSTGGDEETQEWVEIQRRQK